MTQTTGVIPHCPHGEASGCDDCRAACGQRPDCCSTGSGAAEYASELGTRYNKYQPKTAHNAQG